MPNRPETTPSPAADPPRGIICRHCHCPELHVTRTRKGPGGKIYRWRRCDLCGEEQVTTETPGPPKGIVCRECGSSDLRVVQTIKDAGKVRRRRVCQKCGDQQMTTESSTGTNGISR